MHYGVRHDNRAALRWHDLNCVSRISLYDGATLNISSGQMHLLKDQVDAVWEYSKKAVALRTSDVLV